MEPFSKRTLRAEEFAERERLIDDLYSKQVARIGGNDTFNTSGDDGRSLLDRVRSSGPKIGGLLSKIFGPKFARLTGIIALMLIVQWSLGSGWILVPFVLSVVAFYCVAEDTDSSRKLLLVVISRLSRESRKT